MLFALSTLLFCSEENVLKKPSRDNLQLPGQIRPVTWHGSKEQQLGRAVRH